MRHDVVVITGGGGDIAAAIATALAPQADVIALIDLDPARLMAASERLQAVAKATVHVADVRDRAALRSAIGGIVSDHGRVDVLVNVAGAPAKPCAVVDMTDEQYDDLMDSHVRGTFVACQAVVGPMQDQGGGRIVNTASLAAFAAHPRRAVYSAAKAAVVTFTRALASEVGPFGITANCIAPGLTASARVSANFPTEAALRAQIEELGVVIEPLRMASPAEIAAGVRYLCSDDAGYVTGTTLHINGGAYRA
jgi:3-oxoacyl-[acyl-carrier protein] reductase